MGVRKQVVLRTGHVQSALRAGLMNVPQRPQTTVPRPSVGLHHAAGLNVILNKGMETGTRCVLNATQSGSSTFAAIFLHGNHDQRLLSGFPALAPLFQGAPIRLIHLNLPVQSISSRANHGSPQLVQPSPSRPVTAQAQYPLQAQSASAVLLARHPPHGTEPCAQRLMGVLKHRPSRHRSLVLAICTDQQARLAGPVPPPMTPWTIKAVRPPKLEQILPALFNRAEHLLEFGQRFRIMLFHRRPTLRVGPTGVN